MMKRFVAALIVAIALTFTAAPLLAVPDDYDDMQSHPLRVAAYLIYPVGYTMEWLVFRPFHYLVSQPYLDSFFGHRPHQEIGGYR